MQSWWNMADKRNRAFPRYNWKTFRGIWKWCWQGRVFKSHQGAKLGLFLNTRSRQHIKGIVYSFILSTVLESSCYYPLLTEKESKTQKQTWSLDRMQVHLQNSGSLHSSSGLPEGLRIPSVRELSRDPAAQYFSSLGGRNTQTPGFPGSVSQILLQRGSLGYRDTKSWLYKPYRHALCKRIWLSSYLIFL